MVTLMASASVIAVRMIIRRNEICVGILPHEFEHFLQGRRKIKIVVLCKINMCGFRLLREKIDLQRKTPRFPTLSKRTISKSKSCRIPEHDLIFSWASIQQDPDLRSSPPRACLNDSRHNRLSFSLSVEKNAETSRARVDSVSNGKVDHS